MKTWQIILLAVLGVPASFLAYMILCMLAGIGSSLFVNPKKAYTKDSPYFRFVFNSMTGLVLFVCRVRIHIQGVGNIPDGRFLLVGNHRSNWDPIVTWFVLRKVQKLSYVSKPSNLKIPFFGALARRCCFMSIDRESPKNSVKTFDCAAELLKNDEVSVGIYPEGTRSKNLSLLKFHNAVFKVAQKADVPIVIISVKNTEKVHENAPFKKTDVFLEILGVIPAEEIRDVKTAEIGERVRLALEENLGIVPALEG